MMYTAVVVVAALLAPNASVAPVREFTLDPVEEFIDTLPLEDKIGQMFMVGLFTEDIASWKEEFLEEKNFGGVILHPYNMQDANQVMALTATLQNGAKYEELPLFIAVNQEGGEVTGVRFAKEVRGGREVQDEDTAFEVGLARANELKELGINVNFAPVLDVVQEPNSFLYWRSFSGDPETVARIATSYIQGQQEGGIISGGKHFPGHGIALGDSHVNIAVSSAARKDLGNHLLPFRAAAKGGMDMVMVTHMLFPNIDKEHIVPLSKVFMEEMLRKEIGFEGVAITDDLEMRAVRNLASIPEAAILAIEAGVDVVIISGIEEHQRLAYQALLEAVKSGKISEERIDQSVRRILLLKAKI